MRIFLLFALLIFTLTEGYAQHKSDFQTFQIQKETWAPIKGLVNGKFQPSFLNPNSYDVKNDSLVIMQTLFTKKTNKTEDTKQDPPALASKSEQTTAKDKTSENSASSLTSKTENKKEISKNFTNTTENKSFTQELNSEGLSGTGGSRIPFQPNETYGDSLTFARLYSNNAEVLPVNLTVRRSWMREDTTNLYDIEFENIVTVSEELSIDCVWVTLTKYYAVWNSKQINPYRYDISEFTETVPVQLYDSSKNQHWSMPLAEARLTSSFGFRRYRWHHGVDLDLDTGDPVYASFDGIVRMSRYSRGGYGNFVVLRHYNGLETLYGHLSKAHVKVGQFVKAGEEIGKGGSTGRSTGPHLHYEVRYRGYAFDPKEIYDFQNQSIRTDIFKLKPAHFQHLQTQRQTVWHTVQHGESLAKIAIKYSTTVYNICKLNRISSRTTLIAGKKLRIK